MPSSVPTEEPPADDPSLLIPNAAGGADYGTYSFQQTLSSVDVFVPLPRVVKSRDLDVKITNTQLSVNLKQSESPCLLSGALHEKVKLDDCTWTLVDGNTVHIYLEKLDDRKWWSCVIAGHAEIDTKKVVPENSHLSDLDGDIRQTVEKMMFDQRAKAAGLPTSDEREKANIFEKFKAQHPEMDFSKAKVNFSGNS